MKRVAYTKSHVIPAKKLMWDKLVETSNQDSENTYGIQKNNDPCSAYALHIPNCSHKYGNINDTITLLKQINKPTRLLPYEQCIHSHSPITMNSSLNIWTNIIPCLNSSNTNTIHHNQHDIKSIIPLIRPVLSQPVHRTVTYCGKQQSFHQKK